MLVWCDLETTGTDREKDILLEVAFIVTDDDLEERGHYSSLVVDISPVRLDRNWVWEQHFENGLVDDLMAIFKEKPHGCPIVSDVSKEITAFLDSMGVHEGREMSDRPMLCGSSVGFDRSFLRIYMPEMLDLVHYRNIDVSTVRELAKLWAPDLGSPEPSRAHRALADLRDSINLLKFYRDKGFVGLPGE